MGEGEHHGTKHSSCPHSLILAGACVAQVEEPEGVLDKIAEEACAEAAVAADDPAPLLVLVEEVRQLSRR